MPLWLDPDEPKATHDRRELKGRKIKAALKSATCASSPLPSSKLPSFGRSDSEDGFTLRFRAGRAADFNEAGQLRGDRRGSFWRNGIRRPFLHLGRIFQSQDNCNRMRFPALKKSASRPEGRRSGPTSSLFERAGRASFGDVRGVGPQVADFFTAVIFLVRFWIEPKMNTDRGRRLLACSNATR